MIIIILLFVCICIYKTKIFTFNQQYINRNATIQINGIFVFLVLVSHMASYLPQTLPFSHDYFILRKILGQLVVTTFLFFSGFGVMQSIQKNGQAHLKTIPLKLAELLLNFGIAIIFFIIVDIYIGRELEIENVLFSFTGWKSIGNSSWYLFDILALYMFSYISFNVFHKNEKMALLCVGILSVLLILFLMRNKPFERWYNTIPCYFVGMLYSYKKSSIDALVMKNKISYCLSGILLILMLYVFYLYRSDLIPYMVHGILFCLLICWGSMLIRFDNPILKWLGNHIFSIYILQRLPMILGKFWGWSEQYELFFIVFSLFSAILMSYLFDKFMPMLSQRVFKRWRTKLTS